MSSAALASLLDDLPEPELTLAPGVVPRDYGLRWYQTEQKAAVELALQTNRSCLLVAATGTGKTRTFSAIAGDWPGNVLVLCHRDELVHQARADLERITGEAVEIEQGQLRASARARIVVGSIDSVKRQNRLDRFGADRFSLVITDEGHHYTAKTYRRPLEFFKNAKLLGVTATPDRGDEKALGQIFEEVAYVYDIQQGIDDGYLVQVRAHEVTLGEIDISGVKVQGGDLSAAMLDDAMLKACGGIVSETMRYEPTRQGIVFLPGVRSAELCAQLFNKACPGSACFISGGTPVDERRQLVADFRAGVYRYLCNCMIATEGFDAPAASLIVQGRPTKSRALYAQMVGRGTRVLPGVVDHIQGQERAEDRRDAVTASQKPDMVILDFVGNSGRHKLITAADVLGGNYSAPEIELAKKKTKEGGNVGAALEAARKELQRIAQAAKVKASSTIHEVDPFGVLGMKRETNQTDLRFGYRPMSDGQRGFLERAGLKEKELLNLSKPEAQRLIGCIIKRRDLGLATYAQTKLLASHGVTERNISFSKASEALTHIIARQRAGHGPDIGALDGILHRQRQPGDD